MLILTLLLTSGVSSAGANEKPSQPPSAEHYLAQPKTETVTNISTIDLRQQGIISLAQGELPKAIDAFKKLVYIERRRAGSSTKSDAVADAYHVLADCYVQAEMYVDAEQAYLKTIQFAEKTSKNKALVADSLLSLAKLEERKKRYSNAAAFYKQALTFADATKHSDMAETQLRYGAALEHLGKRDEATVAKRKAQEHQKQCRK
jgi:tetratricopeptide (TPR) repeat protein